MDHTKTQEVSFNSKNPPPTKEAAEDRVEILSSRVEQIKVQLEFETEKNFSSDSDYFAWRKSAMSALGYINYEKTYLEWWLYYRYTKPRS